MALGIDGRKWGHSTCSVHLNQGVKSFTPCLNVIEGWYNDV